MGEEKYICAAIGTTLGAVGAGISVSEVQAIVSIIITVLGFVITVLIPLGIKLYKKIKKALEDKKITKEEALDIASTGKEIIDETVSLVNTIKEESDKNQKE